MRRIVAPIAALLALLAVPSGAAAEDLDEQRLELNEAAIDAMIAGDYPRAVELLEQSIELGELNITWLNLGRAYAKAGRCNDALTAYDRMAVAPRVDEPSSDELYQILNDYRAELLVDCPGKVIVRCTPPEMTVSVDDGPEQPCPAEPLELAAGPHTMRAFHQGQLVQERIVEVQGLGTSHLALDAPVAAPIGMGPRDDTTGDLLFGFGVGSVSVAGALLVTFVVLDVVILSETEAHDAIVEDVYQGDLSRIDDLEARRDDIETLQVTNTALLGAGVALGLVGAALLIVDAAVDTSEPSASSAGPTLEPLAPQLVLSPDGGGLLQLGARF